MGLVRSSFLVIAIMTTIGATNVHASKVCPPSELQRIHAALDPDATPRFVKPRPEDLIEYDDYVGKRVDLKYKYQKGARPSGARNRKTGEVVLVGDSFSIKNAEFIGVKDGVIHVRVEINGNQVDRYIPENLLVPGSIKVVGDVPRVKAGVASSAQSPVAKLPLEQQKIINDLQAKHDVLKEWADKARATSKLKKAKHLDDQAKIIKAEIDTTLAKFIKECAS